MRNIPLRVVLALLALLGAAAVWAEDSTAEQVFVPGQDGVSVPTPIRKADVTIPTMLERKHLQVRVQYFLNIMSDGSVKVAQVLSCDARKRDKDSFSKLSEEECDPIDQHVRKVISQWRYAPAVKDGKAVTVVSAYSVTLVPTNAH